MIYCTQASYLASIQGVNLKKVLEYFFLTALRKLWQKNIKTFQ
jgi:hypothetical protein